MTTTGPQENPAAQAPAPADARQLQQEIELTREQLGETIEELIAKADVRSRARAKAAEVSGRVKSKTGQARQGIAGRAGNTRRQIAGKTGSARVAASKGVSGAREYWIPLTLAAGSLIAGCLAIRQYRRR